MISVRLCWVSWVRVIGWVRVNNITITVIIHIMALWARITRVYEVMIVIVMIIRVMVCGIRCTNDFRRIWGCIWFLFYNYTTPDHLVMTSIT